MARVFSRVLAVACIAACDDGADRFVPTGDAAIGAPDAVPADAVPADAAPADEVDVVADTPMLEPDTAVDADAHVAPETVDVSPTATCPEVACAPGELCLDGACTCDPAPVSFASDIAPLMKTGCGPGCHVYNGAVASGSAGLNLAPAFAWAELVAVPTTQCRVRDPERLRVEPGAAGRSYLVHKLEGREMCSGVRMPKGRSPWSSDAIALVGRWICQGALDN